MAGRGYEARTKGDQIRQTSVRQFGRMRVEVANAAESKPGPR